MHLIHGNYTSIIKKKVYSISLLRYFLFIVPSTSNIGMHSIPISKNALLKSCCFPWFREQRRFLISNLLTTKLQLSESKRVSTLSLSLPIYLSPFHIYLSISLYIYISLILWRSIFMKVKAPVDSERSVHTKTSYSHIW